MHYYNPSNGADVRILRVQGNETFTDSIQWGMGLFSISGGAAAARNVLGKTTACRSFHADGLTVFNLALADSFGMVDAQDLADGAWPYYRMWTLIGGSVGGTEIGVLDNIHERSSVPCLLTMEQNYPNPFNPSTTIRFSLPARSQAFLTVFNVLGQQVAELVEGQLEAGLHQVQFRANGLASGLYFYRLKAGETVLTRSMALVR